MFVERRSDALLLDGRFADCIAMQPRDKQCRD
jgi:hypothetical protein